MNARMMSVKPCISDQMPANTSRCSDLVPRSDGADPE